MKRFHICFALLSLLFLSGCGGLAFEDFSAPDGSYKVKMPGKPSHVPPRPMGWDVWQVITRTWAFEVGTDNIPPDTPMSTNALLQSALTNFANGINTQPKSQAPMTINGLPGVEATFSMASRTTTSGKQEPATGVVIRIMISGNKGYLLSARGPTSITKDSPEVKTFFDSFVPVAPTGPPAGSSGTSGASGTMPGGTASTMPGNTMPANMGGAGNPSTGMHSTMPPGTYSSAGGGGTVPTMPTTMPMGIGPMPTGSYSTGGGATASNSPNSAAAAMHASAAASGGTSPMPAASYNSGTGATGAGGNSPNSAAAAMHASANNGMPPNNFGPNSAGGPGMPGAPGQRAAQIEYTGTPILRETKLKAGDQVQWFMAGRWVNAKVQEVNKINGMVQVKAEGKQGVWRMVPRMMLQFAPGADVPTVASADDEPRAKPAKSAAPKTETVKSDTPKSGTLISIDGASVEDLLKIIGNKLEHRRVKAAENLRDHSSATADPDIAKKLVELMKVDELTVRAGVAGALEKWYSPEVSEAVLKNVSASTKEVRQSMLRILAANKVEGAAQAIANRLTDNDDRKVATESLIALGESAQEATIAALNSKDSKVKAAACDVLKEIGSADAAKALKKSMESWTGTDRIAARKALQAIEAKK